MFDEHYVTQLLRAVNFAAARHRLQTRKGAEPTPYINHPLAVTETLWVIGGVRELNILLAALLHDTLEDTATTAEELAAAFGSEVAAMVAELTDDERLPKPERKRWQEVRAASLSRGAQLIRLADKAANVYDVAHHPPAHWLHERRVAYLDWTARVVAGLRGVNASLEAHYAAVLAAARQSLAAQAPAPEMMNDE